MEEIVRRTGTYFTDSETRKEKPEQIRRAEHA